MGLVPIASSLTVAMSPHTSLTKYMKLSKRGFPFPLGLLIYIVFVSVRQSVSKAVNQLVSESVKLCVSESVRQ